jgi:lipoprotein NlpI
MKVWNCSLLHRSITTSFDSTSAAVRVLTQPTIESRGPRLPISHFRAMEIMLGGIFAVTLILLPARFVLAQWRTSQDAEICVAGTGVASLQIAVCRRALGRDGLSDLDRASVLTARGKAYRDLGRTASAMADFDTALTLNPYSADTFHERARALDLSGRYQRALENFQHALTLSPRFAAAHKNRGVAHFYAGNFACARVDLDGAAALASSDAEIYAFRGFLNYIENRQLEAASDFRRVEVLNLPYPYLPLWIYLTRAEIDDAERGILVEARAALAPGEWPDLLLEAYLGERDPHTLIITLESDVDSLRGRRRLAASHFYLAALELRHGQPHPALLHLETALKLAERRTPERVMAEHALAAPKGERGSSAPGGC